MAVRADRTSDGDWRALVTSSGGTVPDVIVIGAGPNGLVAANLLADAGWDVVVLEEQPRPGGAVRSSELIEPAFVNDECSAFYPFVPVSPIARLHLEDQGLRWCHPPLVLAHPSEDGSCPVLSRDRDETAAALDALHAGDGAAWLQVHDEWRRIREPLVRALLSPFPPVRAGATLLRRLGRDSLRFARFLLLPVRRMATERFGGDGAAWLLAGAALHVDYGPDATASGFFGWLLLMLGQDHGFPVPQGGAGQMTDAMVRRLAARGGVVRCGQRVERVTVRHGRVTGVVADGREHRARHAVVADVDAVALYRDQVPPDQLPERLLEDIDRFQRDHATVKVDWTLDGPVPWLAQEARRAGTVHVVEGMDGLTEQHSELARRLLPRRPFLLVGQQSMTDPSRQPPGKETAWAYTHVPHEVAGDAGGHLDGPAWVQGFADRMEQQIEARAPGFRDKIRGRFVAGPAELQAHDANLVDGALSGGTSQLHQMLVLRPVPGWGRAETPVRGLYLASASAHPGAAVHGAPGANAARAAIWHRRAGRVMGR